MAIMDIFHYRNNRKVNLEEVFNLNITSENFETVESNFRTLEKLMNRELRLWWDVATLEKYLTMKMVPQQLRWSLQIYDGDDSIESKEDWNEFFNQCGLQLISKLVSKKQTQLGTLNQQIESLKLKMEPDINTPEAARLSGNLQKSLEKEDEVIQKRKQKKMQRDLMDYRSKQIYRWQRTNNENSNYRPPVWKDFNQRPQNNWNRDQRNRNAYDENQRRKNVSNIENGALGNGYKEQTNPIDHHANRTSNNRKQATTPRNSGNPPPLLSLKPGIRSTRFEYQKGGSGIGASQCKVPPGGPLDLSGGGGRPSSSGELQNQKVHPFQKDNPQWNDSNKREMDKTRKKTQNPVTVGREEGPICLSKKRKEREGEAPEGAGIKRN